VITWVCSHRCHAVVARGNIVVCCGGGDWSRRMHRTECNWLPGGQVPRRPVAASRQPSPARRWSRIDHVTIVIASIALCRQIRAMAICLRCRGIDMARRPVIVETPDGFGGLVEWLPAPADRASASRIPTRSHDPAGRSFAARPGGRENGERVVGHGGIDDVEVRQPVLARAARRGGSRVTLLPPPGCASNCLEGLAIG
jgi:hypothetical protein